MVGEPAARRTQDERSAAMRARLLEATVESLATKGYAATTTTEVVRRAGVSRGAQVHHFPTKQDLVLEAIAYIRERRHEEFRVAFSSLDPAERSLAGALDLLWEMYRSPTYAAWLELAVAARSDPPLHAALLAMERRFAADVEELFTEIFPGATDSTFARLAVEFAFALLDGLALQHHVGVGADAEELLGMLKFLAATFSADIGGSP